MLEHKNTQTDLEALDFKTEIKVLQKELCALQQKLKEAKVPVIVLFEGWSAAGKGRMISKLISELDPRDYQVYSNAGETPDEARRPFLWRFWRDLPPQGEMAVLDRSWYRRALEAGKEERAGRVEDINIFERQLCDDGYLLLKFFLHIGCKEQRARLTKLAGHPATAWRVTQADWEQNRRYDQEREALSGLLEATNPSWAPWRVIWNEDKHAGVYEALSAIRDAIAGAVAHGAPRPGGTAGPRVALLDMPRLRSVDLSPALTEEEYVGQMKKERKRLQTLHEQLYREKIPAVFCFEGWDAAGKGGAIRRLSWALDPRGFDVVPIAAPTPGELHRHYLWRFWRQLPKDGHIAIFDRSWYGRVMVERVEGFTPEARWSMAYDEINEFEGQLCGWGAVVLKFWLQIDQETQLARFTRRQDLPEKQYKITEEDWRNRAKWPEYELAVDEMLGRTSTEAAPWIIVEGNDKRYARLKVLRAVRKALEKRLEEKT